MVTDADLIALSKGLGYDLTPRMLERWRNLGLLPPLKRHGRGRARGQTWGYVNDPSAQLRALLEMRARDLGSPECAVRLWLLEFPVTLSTIRRHLPAALRALHKIRQYSPQYFGEKLADHLQRSARSRKKWIARWDEAAYSKISNFGSVLLGGLEPADAEARQDYSTVAGQYLDWTEDERVLVRQLGEDPHVLQQTMPEIFRLIADSIFDASDADLLEARRIHKPFTQMLQTAAQLHQRAPNPFTSLLGRSDSGTNDLVSSSGFVLAYGLLQMTRKYAEPFDLLSNISGLTDSARAALARIEAPERPFFRLLIR